MVRATDNILDEFKNKRKSLNVNGLQLKYCTFGNSKQCMIILHTLRTQAEYTYKIIPELSNQFKCYILDLPGHGFSEKNTTLTYNEELFTQTVKGFIQTMKLKNVIVVGESIGGTVALSLASEIPEQLKQVIAFNPYDNGSMIGGWRGNLVSFFGKSMKVVTKAENLKTLKKVMGEGYYNSEKLTDEFIQLLLETPSNMREFSSTMKSCYKNASSWKKARKNNYKKIPNSFPVHLVYGDHDWSREKTRHKNAASIMSVESPMTMKNTGHFSFIDNSDEVIRIIQHATRMD